MTTPRLPLQPDGAFVLTVETLLRSRHAYAGPVTDDDLFELEESLPWRELVAHDVRETDDGWEVTCEWVVWFEDVVDGDTVDGALATAADLIATDVDGGGPVEIVDQVLHSAYRHVPPRPIVDVIVRDGLL